MVTKKLYAIITNDYGDYRIISMFSSKEVAEESLKKIELSGDFFNVEIEEFNDMSYALSGHLC